MRRFWKLLLPITLVILMATGPSESKSTRKLAGSGKKTTGQRKNPPGQQAEEPASEEPFARDAWVLAWSGNGDQLLYREETLKNQEITVRAVLLAVNDAHVLREFQIQSPGDSPESIAEGEQAVGKFIETEGFVSSGPAQFFVGRNRKGFLSPAGDYLVDGLLSFTPRPGKRGLQTLHIQFQKMDLGEGPGSEIVQMELDSLDGEHQLAVDSIGAVSVGELAWNPQHNALAVTLEERRPAFLVKGILTLPLKNLADAKPTPAVAESATVTTPKAPTEYKRQTPSITSSSSNEPTAPVNSAAIQHHHLPLGGTPFQLQWKSGKSATSKNGEFQAVQNYYQACNSGDEIFSAQVTLLEKSTQKFNEFPVSTNLNQADLGLQFEKETLQILYLGEPLRTITLRPMPVSQAFAFAVQMGSYSNEASAKALVDKLCMQALPAYYLSFQEGADPKTLFRVRVGRFKNEKLAKQFAQKKIKPLFQKFLVTKF